MPRKIVIAGGVAGGASCAARLRRLDETAEIVLLERGGYISFANCGLPYYIGNIITDRDELILQTPESFYERFRVNVRINSNVTEIRRESHVVIVEHDGETYEEPYDYLVLATGGRPIRPMLPGAKLENVMQLWNLSDMDRIFAAARSEGVSSVAVVGGGFIGLEVAENLCRIDLHVTLLEKQPHVLPPFDFDMAQLIHKELAENGVRLLLNEAVERFDQTDDGKVRITTDKRQLEVDFVVLSIGVCPNSELAAAAGLETNARGHIIVNAKLQTSDPRIFAVGDVIEVENFVSHIRQSIPLAGPANKMGRIAADNICSANIEYHGTQGTSIVQVFSQSAAGTGLSEEQLNARGLSKNVDYRVTVVCPQSHAGYYPDSQQMILKLIFDTDGRILGAQAIGSKGVDKRMDIVATAMRLGADVRTLCELELCYAPPFSSAKDPINMAGYSASNILDGLVDNITCDELASLGKEVRYLDVRTEEEAAYGKIAGSLLIPVDALRERIAELQPDHAYVVYCAVGIRGYIACRILMQNGFKNVRNLAGGYRLYRDYSASYGEE